jgi:hypothetical protein
MLQAKFANNCARNTVTDFEAASISYYTFLLRIIEMPYCINERPYIGLP